MTSSKTLDQFCVYTSDVISHIFMKLAKANPVRIAALYFFLSFMVTYILGFITGQFWGKNGLDPMFSQIVDNINLAVLAPVGAALLCNLYNTIEHTMKAIETDDILADKELPAYYVLVDKLYALYNNRVVLAVSLLISLGLNGYNYLMKPDSWLSINGGITGLYGRLFVVFNYYIIALIFYKAAVTVWGLQKILKMELQIQPMHPDHAGGLKPIGNLAVAVNTFLILIIVYITLLIIFDPFASSNFGFFIIFFVLYIATPILFLLSLSKAKKQMSIKKQEAYYRLNATFDYYFQLLSSRQKESDIYDINSADELIKINELYQIVDKMPVWPFDIQNIRRFLVSILFPLVVFIINQILDTGSIFHQLILH